MFSAERWLDQLLSSACRSFLSGTFTNQIGADSTGGFGVTLNI